MVFGLRPISAATLRIAPRSASSGTPVKSCSTTRAATNGISSVRGDVLGGHLLAVAVAQHALEHDAQRHRQAADGGIGLCELRQREEAPLASRPGGEGLEGGRKSVAGDVGGHERNLVDGSRRTDY